MLSNDKKWVLAFLRPYAAKLTLYFFLETFSIVMGLTFIWCSKRAIDFAVLGEILSMKRSLLGLALAAGAGLFASQYAKWLNERTLALMLIDIQGRIFAPNIYTNWATLTSSHTGDLMHRTNVDAQEVVQVLGQSIISAIVMGLRLLGATALLWSMDPALAIILLAICPLLLISKVYFRRLRHLHGRLKTAEGQLGNTFEENFRFRTLIASFNMYGSRIDKLRKGQKQVYDLKAAIINFSTFSRGTINIIASVGFFVTFYWGVGKLSVGEISFGTLSAFLQLVVRIQGPALSLMGFIPTLVKFNAAKDRVLEIAGGPYTEPKEEKLKVIEEISLSDVYFQYEDKQVLNGLNVSFARGVPTAVLGPSGKGKTTLLRLLLKLLEPQRGKISIRTNGQCINLEESHRVNIGYVPQGDKLFSGTIRENLNVETASLCDEQIRQALVICCAEFVFDLPQGIDTQIGESGYGLSEGQMQRIAVARAVLGDYPIWLFDEVTSALDPDTASKLVKNLISLGEDKIMVFITHDVNVAHSVPKTILFS